MNPTSIAKRLFHSPSWSFLGFVLAILFGLFAVYVEFFRDLGSEPRFEILSDASVFDVHEPLEELTIVYEGVNIAARRQTLRLVVVRLINRGSGVVLHSHYDDRAPITLEIAGAELVRPELLGASNDYLREFARVSQPRSGVIQFNPLILEPGEWISVKLLVLNKDGTTINFTAGGKVAGVRQIRIVDVTEGDSGPGFWNATVGGPLWTQAARLAFYSLSMVVLLVVIGASSFGIGVLTQRMPRKRDARKFRKRFPPRVSTNEDWILEGYVDEGVAFLEALERAGEDPRFGQLVGRYLDNQDPEAVEQLRDFLFDPRPGIHRRPNRADIKDRIELMKRNEFLEEKNQGWIVNTEQWETASKLLGFVKLRNYRPYL